VSREKGYILTLTARAQLREAKAWSLKRWGRSLTETYFSDLHQAAQLLAENPHKLKTREELAGGTGLLLYPVREHLLVYEPFGNDKIIIVAVIRQGRDIPEILRRGKHVFERELSELRSKLGNSGR
jgi:plasmid stabilization system protein ParE